jgi:hypothetical protein
MNVRCSFVLCLGFMSLVSCAHPNRISRSTLQRLTRDHEPFVLVFGSVSTPTGQLAHPTIRFIHQTTRKDPEYLLWSLNIASGDRFFAVLKRPEQLPYLDEFYVEVGSDEVGFDKIMYVHLRQGDAPLAMYVGDIGMSPAQQRMAQGQKIVVNIHDQFQAAAQELKRLYPRYEGTVTKAAILRNPIPIQAAPERTR